MHILALAPASRTTRKGGRTARWPPDVKAVPGRFRHGTHSGNEDRVKFHSGDAIIAPCGPGRVADPHFGATAELTSVGEEDAFRVYTVLMFDGEVKRFAEAALRAA